MIRPVGAIRRPGGFPGLGRGQRRRAIYYNATETSARVKTLDRAEFVEEDGRGYALRRAVLATGPAGYGRVNGAEVISHSEYRETERETFIIRALEARLLNHFHPAIPIGIAYTACFTRRANSRGPEKRL